MKTIYLLISVASFAAFLALPVNAAITGSVSFAASLALILTADYGPRPARFWGARAKAGRNRESLRLAA